MTYEAESVEDYINKLPEDRVEVIRSLWSCIKEELPTGYEERLSYGFPSFVVPLETYPEGYKCKKNEPLPFISIASQKNYIAIYHMGIYAMPDLLEWFKNEYKKLNIGKLDMGKSCIRLKNIKRIPYDLIRHLVRKVTVEEWITIYEKSTK